MKMKKFLAISVIGLFTLTGCSTVQKADSNHLENSQEASAAAKSSVENNASTENENKSESKQNNLDPVTNKTDDASLEESSAPIETPEETVSNDEVTTQQIQTLAGLIGKTAHDANVVLGQPSTSKNIENTKVLAANYYKIAFCDEIAKVEVDFDVDTQKVNYVSFTIMLADNIDASKETFINVLTSLYGESTTERYLDVKGKQRRDWNDGTLDYDLKYYENNISLDIYPLDK